MKGLFIGLTAIDVIYPLDRFPEENSKVRAVGDQMDIGGPATNAAYAFAALGGEATLVSWVGDHALSSFISDRLDAYGIHHLDLNARLKKDAILSCVMLNLQSASRTIVTAQVDMEVPIVHPDLHLKDYQVICVDGFFGDYVVGLLKKNDRTIPVVFDGGSYKAHTDQILPWVTYPILSGHFNPPNAQLVGDYMAMAGHSTFAVTNGEKPILSSEKGVQSDIVVPKVKAIDTLGAGDIFHGAFSKFIIDYEGDFRSALYKASQVASLSCKYIGAREWVKAL